MQSWPERHVATQHFSPLFNYAHLPEGLREISKECALLANLMVAWLRDGPELTTGLRNLLVAKDCFVRQAFLDQEAR